MLQMQRHVNSIRLISLLFQISALVLLLSTAQDSYPSFVLCISLLIVAIIIELTISKSSRGYLSIPIAVVIAVFYLFIGLNGFYSNSNLSISSLSGFRVKLPPLESRETLRVYLLIVSAIMFGYSLNSKGPSANHLDPKFRQKEAPELARMKSRFRLIHITYFFLFTNATYLFLFGMDDLLFRTEYIPIQSNISNNFFLSLVNVVNLIGFLGLGWASGQLRGAQRFICFLTFFFSLLIYFGDGSRTFGLGLVLFFTGRLIDKKSPLRFIAFIISVPISAMLTNLVISFRRGSTHGLIGNFSQIGQFDFLSAGNYFQSNVSASSFAITGYTGFIANPIPIKNLFIEINPLPGGFTGWYNIANEMRFNYYTPFTSIGELFNYSPLILFLFFAALGLFTRNLVLFQSSSGLSIFNLRQNINVGSILLFVLLSIQYNLRSSLRVLYLAILVNTTLFYLQRRRLKVTGD